MTHRSPQKRSKRQETRLARKSGGSRRAGSGNKWFAKQDVATETLLFQIKYTDKKSYSLKLEDLVQLQESAGAEGRVPVMMIEFMDHHHPYRHVRAYVLSELDYQVIEKHLNASVSKFNIQKIIPTGTPSDN